MNDGMYIKELLTRDAGTEGSLLIQKKIYDTLIAPPLRARIGRNRAAFVLGPSSIPGSSVDVNLTTSLTMKVNKIAEGGAVPIKVVDHTNINIKPAKYGCRPLVTKEMQEDGKWDLIMVNIGQAGLEMGYNEDKVIIADSLDSAASANAISTGGAMGYQDLGTAKKKLRENDFEPDTLFVGPKVLNDLENIDSFMEANKIGDSSNIRNGLTGKIRGMDVVLYSPNIAPSTTYTNIAYAIDSRNAFFVAEKRPLTIEKYDDVTHDLSGVVVTQRFAASYLRTLAMSKITTT
uniref:Putative capsid protein n=1 Tax=viral metagenome TaxID=1070528 RepID=A0A6H1ZNQ2_9ZZZZ